MPGAFHGVPYPREGRMRISVNEALWKGESLSMAEKTDSNSLRKYLLLQSSAEEGFQETHVSEGPSD